MQEVEATIDQEEGTEASPVLTPELLEGYRRMVEDGARLTPSQSKLIVAALLDRAEEAERLKDVLAGIGAILGNERREAEDQKADALEDGLDPGSMTVRAWEGRSAFLAKLNATLDAADGGEGRRLRERDLLDFARWLDLRREKAQDPSPVEGETFRFGIAKIIDGTHGIRFWLQEPTEETVRAYLRERTQGEGDV